MAFKQQEPGELQTRLEDASPLYILPRDDVIEEVLIPALSAASAVDCMMGFFTSDSLAEIAPGLATFIAGGEHPLRLLISPYLTLNDRAAIESGVRVEEQVTAERFFEALPTASALTRHTLACLTWLIRKERVVIKIGIMRDAVFHPKVWLIRNGNARIALHGSSSMTHRDIRRNKEQLALARSWMDHTQQQTVDRLQREFDTMWHGADADCLTVDLPRAVREKLLSEYRDDRPPSEDEFRSLRRRAPGIPGSEITPAGVWTEGANIHIPADLNYTSGDYEQQGRAVTAWCSAAFCGVLEMVTGSGKTITAMIGARRLHEQASPLLMVVAAPYVPLIGPWCDALTRFGVKPVDMTAFSDPQQRGRALRQIRRRLRLGLSAAEAIVVSHDTLCSREFQDALAAFECARLLIADEVYGLERESFITNLPEFFEYRLGLSATPIEEYDEEGTELLFEFFGSVVFRFTLKEATGGLLGYEHFVRPVYMSDDEMNRWYELTEAIRQNAWRQENG
jgi:hypothetical protein